MPACEACEDPVLQPELRGSNIVLSRIHSLVGLRRSASILLASRNFDRITHCFTLQSCTHLVSMSR